MALTPTITNRTQTGNRRRRLLQVQFDASYVTGGQAFVPSDCALTTIDAVDFSHAVLGAANSTNVVRYDSVNNKLMVFTAAGAEVANATNLSTFVATLEVVGL